MNRTIIFHGVFRITTLLLWLETAIIEVNQRRWQLSLA